ncbi:MAG: M28 family peptidase [Actinomycetes bacterium]
MPRLRKATALAATAALLVASAATTAYAAPNNNTVRKLTGAVTVDGVMDHLEAFQQIADANGGNRASGLPGYKASVDYVVEQLESAGYDPVVQEFTFDYFEENSELIRVSPLPRTFVEGIDFLRNTFDSGTPEGTATGALTPVDLVLNPAGPANSSTSGCEPADFAGFPAGAIALLQRGTCGFAVKALNAQAAGASAVIIMNEGQPGRTGLLNMIGDATGLTIPAVFATYDAGVDLAQTPGATVTVTVDFTEDQRTSYNVLAETKSGNDANVVMAGAHLDSVQEGPGINDNGSGSAALLETAIQFAKVKPANTVRFAWWGAEEYGLLGSEYYVAHLTEEEAASIALYLNFDMVASPNYMFGVYDGDNSGGTAPAGFIPAGSAEIEDVFESFYISRGEPYQDSEFSGRSDYGPFIAVGIPAGGLFTGAEGVKTAQEQALYGGTAGIAYDPCYHAACDDLDNLSLKALDVNSDAIATAVLTFATSTADVNGVAGKPGRRIGQLKLGGADPVDAMAGRLSS